MPKKMLLFPTCSNTGCLGIWSVETGHPVVLVPDSSGVKVNILPFMLSHQH